LRRLFGQIGVMNIGKVSKEFLDVMDTGIVCLLTATWTAMVSEATNHASLINVIRRLEG
jgi:hypothetical protein